jgi:hypothetical protein
MRHRGSAARDFGTARGAADTRPRKKLSGEGEEGAPHLCPELLRAGDRVLVHRLVFFEAGAIGVALGGNDLHGSCNLSHGCAGGRRVSLGSRRRRSATERSGGGSAGDRLGLDLDLSRGKDWCELVVRSASSSSSCCTSPWRPRSRLELPPDHAGTPLRAGAYVCWSARRCARRGASGPSFGGSNKRGVATRLVASLPGGRAGATRTRDRLGRCRGQTRLCYIARARLPEVGGSSL